MIEIFNSEPEENNLSNLADNINSSDEISSTSIDKTVS